MGNWVNGILSILFYAGSLFVTSPAVAGNYPERDVTLIVPYAAKGGSDTQARIAAASLEKVLGKTFLVVNKTGGKGTIGVAETAKAKPDGYTLGCFVYPDIAISQQYMQTQYKVDDFIYIGAYSISPVSLILGKDVPYKTLHEFIAYAKKKPGEITVGIGSDSQKLAVLLFEQQAGIKVTTVFYKSGPEVLKALKEKRIQAAMMCSQFAKVALQHSLPVAGTCSVERVKALNGVPTFKEQGIDVVTLMQRIFVVPKNTPEACITALSKAFAAAAKDPALQEKIEKIGSNFVFMDSTKLTKYIEEQNAVYLPTVQKNKERFTE